MMLSVILLRNASLFSRSLMYPLIVFHAFFPKSLCIVRLFRAKNFLTLSMGANLQDMTLSSHSGRWPFFPKVWEVLGCRPRSEALTSSSRVFCFLNPYKCKHNR